MNDIDENEMIRRNREKFYQIQIDRLERALAQVTAELQTKNSTCTGCDSDSDA